MGHLRTPQPQLPSRISAFTRDVELFPPCRDLGCSSGQCFCALTLLLIPSTVNYLLSLSVVLCHRLGWSSLCSPTGCHVRGYLWSSSTSEMLNEEMKVPCHTSAARAARAVPAALPGNRTKSAISSGCKSHCLLLFLAGQRMEL